MILAANTWNAKNHTLVGSAVWSGTLILTHIIWVSVQKSKGRTLLYVWGINWSELKGVTDQTGNEESITKKVEEPALYKSRYGVVVVVAAVV